MHHRTALGTLLALAALGFHLKQSAAAEREPENCHVTYRNVNIDGVDIF
jgi:hypothetical protein